MNLAIIKNKLNDWYEIYKNSKDVRAIALSNIVSVVPESITPFFTIWLISYYQLDSAKIGIWVTLLLISQSIGSFIVPILASRLGSKLHIFADYFFIL